MTVTYQAIAPSGARRIAAARMTQEPAGHTLQPSGANLNLTWPQGTLLQAASPTGPWSRAASTASPFAVTPTNVAEFFQILLQ